MALNKISENLILSAKFNFEQLLFEAFFDIVGSFGSVEPRSESTFPFQYIIMFRKWQSLKPPSSTLEGDIHMRLLTFLVQN